MEKHKKKTDVDENPSKEGNNGTDDIKQESCTECDAKCEQTVQQDNNTENCELDTLKNKLEEKSKQCDEYFNKLQRAAAEFDNYKKRTAREKEALYTDAVCDVVTTFLPVIDNIERAIKACTGDEKEQSIKEGMDLVSRQVKDVLDKLGVTEIKSVGETFDPQLHNAVMHIEDDANAENMVVEEFQKGYMLNDKVIRHSMVKVAN